MAFSEFTICNATLKEMEFFLTLAKEEGWNPGLNDDKVFFQTDPGGFFLGKLNHEIIGCISAVKYNETFGFIGFYIILPKYRGQGFGLQLWNHAIHYLGHRCIGLDGVPAQEKNYKKSHFIFYYNNLRFECKQPNTQVSTFSSLFDIKKINLFYYKKILEYDKQVFGIDRSHFLKQWFQMPSAISLAKVENDQIKGFGVIRRCHKGYKIGPLFADNFEYAKEIYQTLSGRVESEPVYLDVPEINLDALKLVTEEKLEKVFETVRMYSQPPPKMDLEKVFGVTTFELG